MRVKDKSRKPKKSNGRRIAEWTTQIAIFTVAVAAIGFWQTRNMVGTGENAPKLSLTDLDGNRLSLSDSDGIPVVLYFFAPWCSVCHATSHNINALSDAYTPDELKIFAVGLGWETSDDLRRFSEKHALKVPVLIGDKKTQAAYRISSFPSVYILDREHRISYRIVGYTTELGLRLRTTLAAI